MKIEEQEWYQALIEDIKAVIVETGFSSRWMTIEQKWHIGDYLLNASEQIGVTQLLHRGAVDLNRSYRDLWYCLQLRKLFPDLNKLPDGKGTSWRKIRSELLPAPPQNPTPPLPKGKYQIILADPPWDIKSMILDKWADSLDDKYSTMSLNKLKKVKVENLTDDNCVCFLWFTHTTLSLAQELLKDWGFKYHCILTWDKGGGWTVAGFHRKTEHLLVGYKGKMGAVIKQEGGSIPTLFEEPKTTHSTKPDILYKLIEARTTGNKLELFARRSREGWKSWGNEV